MKKIYNKIKELIGNCLWTVFNPGVPRFLTVHIKTQDIDLNSPVMSDKELCNILKKNKRKTNNE